MDMPTQVKDHEKRLRVVEAFMNSDGEKNKNVEKTFERMEHELKVALEAFSLASKELLEAVEKRFASKTDLDLLKQGLKNDLRLQESEGKWKARFVGASSSVVTALILLILGLLIPQS